MDNKQTQLDGQMSDASSQDSNQTSEVDVGLTNEQPADKQLAAAASCSCSSSDQSDKCYDCTNAGHEAGQPSTKGKNQASQF